MSGLTVALRLTADGSQLVGEIRGSEDALKKLGATSRDAGKQVATGLDGASTAADRFRETAAKLVTAGGALYAFEKIKDMAGAVGGALITAEAQVVKFRAAFGTLGDANLVAREFEYVRSVSREMGIELTSAANSYTKLAMASRGTALEGKATQEIFTSIAQASTAMGLSAAETEGALLAISQMISKGVVSAEELRGQLGERLPGAFQIAARAMGVTTAELGKMLEQGEILAEDFLPRFGRQVTKELGQASKDAASTAARELERVKSGWNEMVMAIADAGAAEGISRVLRGIGDDFSAVAERIRIAKAEGAGFLGQAWAAISLDTRTAAQRLGDADRTLADPNAGFYQRWQAGNDRDRAASQLGALGMASGYTDETARGSAAAAVKAYTDQKTAADAAAKAVDGYASATARLSDAQRKAADIAKENAEFQKAVAGLSRDSAEYARAEAAHKTALTNIEERYTKSKGAGTAASKARRDALADEREKQDGLNETIQIALDLDEKRQKAAELEADLAMTRLERYEEAEAAAAKQIQSADDMIAAIERETALMGMSNIERETTLALLELEKTLVGDTAGEYERYAEKVRDAVANREIRRAAIESAEELKRAGDRAADQVGQAFAQSIMDGGKSAADQLKRLFANLVLTPAVNAFVNPIAQGVTSAFSGGASGVSSGLSLASSLGSLGSLGSFAATGFMNTVAGTGMMGGLSAAGSLMSGGSIAGGLGMGLGAVAPYALAAVALYQLLSSGGEKRSGGTYGYSATGAWAGGDMKWVSDAVGGEFAPGQTRFIGGPSGGEIGGETIRASVAATVAGIDGLFARLGSSEKVDQFWGKLEQSTKGRGGVFAGGQLASGATFGEASWESGTSRTLSAEEALQAFALDLQQSVIQALQASDGLPQAIAGMLDGIDAEALGQEQVSALLASVEAFSQLAPVLDRLGIGMGNVRTAALEAAGGVEQFGSVAAAYYDVTRSDSEKLADATEAVREQFAALGVEAPASVADLRATVEELMWSAEGSTDAGQALIVQLMALAPALAQVTQAGGAVAATLDAMTSGMRQALEGGALSADDWVAYAQSVADPALLASTLQTSFAAAWQQLDLGEAFPVPATIDELKAAVAGLQVSAMGSTEWSEKLAGALRLAPEFASLVDALNATGQGVAATVDRIAQSMNTLSNLSSLYSQAEYKTMMEPLLQQQFAAILGEGSAMPTTAAAMRDLVESITDPDVKASLAEFVGTWDDFYVVQQKVATSAVRATSAVNSAADAMRTAMQGVAEYVQGLFTSQFAVGSPEEQLAYARAQYDQTYARAQGGDAQAMSDVTRYADQVFRLGQDYYGGATGGYVAIFEQIVAQLQALTGSRSSSPSSGPTRGEDLSRAQLREQQRGNRLSERQLSMAQRAASRPSYAY